LSNLELLAKELRSSREYLKRLEQGEFGHMWTKLAQTKVKSLMETYRTIYNGVIEEIEHTKLE
ncbi:MAG: hypothetical protein NWE81_01490, partial [Candidatus Bathyarchaeota archaeon]|nr:hypothetical protein [Candidatus Bathyarchaeota archaeon]